MDGRAGSRQFFTSGAVSERRIDVVDIDVTVVLSQLNVDVRRDPGVMKRLRDVTLDRIQEISRRQGMLQRQMLDLPVVGPAVVILKPVPHPGEQVHFHIDFRLPLFDQAETPIVTEDDTKIFSEAARLPREDWTPYWQRIYLDTRVKERALYSCSLAQTLREHEISRMTLDAAPPPGLLWSPRNRENNPSPRPGQRGCACPPTALTPPNIFCRDESPRAFDRGPWRRFQTGGTGIWPGRRICLNWTHRDLLSG